MQLEEYKALMQTARQKMQNFTAKEQVIAYTGGKILSSRDGIEEYVDDTPSALHPFGSRLSWLAIKTSGHKQVVTHLNRYHQPVWETNWEKGVEGAYHHFCFVTPPINNWVLVLNPNLAHITTAAGQETLSQLSKTFGETHFYACHRSPAYCAFGKFMNGQMLRGFSSAEGVIQLNAGEMTAIEHRIVAEQHRVHTENPEYLADLYASKGLHALLNESSLNIIAGVWSVDPTVIYNYEATTSSAALGYIFKDFDAKMVLEVVLEKTRVLKLAGSVEA